MGDSVKVITLEPQVLLTAYFYKIFNIKWIIWYKEIQVV